VDLQTEQSACQPLTVARGILAAASRDPLKVALRHGARTRRYGEFAARIKQVAAAVAAESRLSSGDHALIVARNCIEYPELVCGLGEAGLTVATITARIAPRELEAICADADARLLIADSETAKIVRAANLPSVRRVITVGPDYERWLEGARGSRLEAAVCDAKPWIIGYTSGTTGEPKGVLLSHRSRVLLVRATAAKFGCYSESDRYLAVTPLNHGGALLRLMATLFHGGYVEVQDKFDAAGLLRTLTEGRFTSTALVPTHFHDIFALPCEFLSANRPMDLRVLLSHGAPLSQSMKAQIVGYFGENVLYETYGSTEAGIVSSIGPGDQLRKLDCVGTPFPDTDIRILDEHGRGCSLGEAGELFSRSPYQFDGYWNKPLETASALKDGWVSVGDIARQDDEGFLYIVGRKKDMIISGGINIYPREVEDVLVSHPDVAEAAVFGVPDEKWGQRLRAVVVMSGRKSVTANDIISHCQGKLASFKIPREIAFRGSLPRNPLGKVMKDELQATWEEITG